jgi:fructose transport system substrate-binding protein
VKRAAQLLATGILATGPIVVAASASDVIIGLITKTDTNPFFVKMKEGAQAQAKEFSAKLRSFAGRYDGDDGAQIEAIESLIAAGATGILITPLNLIDAADATFATDTMKAGVLIGQQTKATPGAKAADAKPAALDLSEAQITVDVLRNQGFLQGIGVDRVDPKKM